MTSRVMVFAALVALGAIGAHGQQSTIPPPTVPPPVPPTTAPVGQGRGAPPQAPPRPGVPATQRINSSIVVIGQVVDATGGRAVPQAIVRLAGGGIRQTRLCDDKGRFFFRDLPPGDVVVTASKSGFIDGAYGKRRAGSSGVPLSLVAGHWVSDLRIELFRQAAISGVVLDETDEPVVGARVVAMQRQFVAGAWRHQPAGRAETDDEGRYRLFGLAPGEYSVVTPMTQVAFPISALEEVATSGSVASSLPNALRLTGVFERGPQALLAAAAFTPDRRYVYWSGEPAPPPEVDGREFVYPTQYYPSADRPLLAMPVIVAPGEDRRGVNFQLRPTAAARISGHVKGPKGALADQLVRLIRADEDDPGSGGEVAATVTDREGAFSLIHVPAGQYQVTVGTPIFLPASAPADAPETVSLSQAQYWGATTVSVTDDGAVDDVVVNAQPGATMAGEVAFRVQGTGVRPTGAQLEVLALTIAAVSGPNRGFPIAVHLDTHGMFQAAGLSPGRYFIHLGPLPSGWYLDSIRAGGQNALDTPLVLTPGDSELVLIGLTDRGTTIAGTGRDARMRPASGTAVIVMAASNTDALWNPNRVGETRANSDGMFTINGLPPGEYLAVAIDDADAEGWQEADVLAALRRAATRTTLRAAEIKTLQLRLTPVRR